MFRFLDYSKKVATLDDACTYQGYIFGYIPILVQYISDPLYLHFGACSFMQFLV